MGVDGIVRPSRKFKNAGLSALALWFHLAEVYLDPLEPAGTHKYAMPSHRFLMDMSLARKIWALADDPSQPRHLRIVQMVCFDLMILKRKDFLVTAEAMEQTHREIEKSTFAEQAAWLREHAEDESVFGAAWQQTDVSDNLWVIHVKWDDAAEDEDYRDEGSRPYDINRDVGHTFIEIPN